MTNIPKSNWYIVIGEKKPVIECPDCGGLLIGDRAPHGVKQTGELSAAVLCPCGVDDHITLQGWKGGIIPPAHNRTTINN